MLSTSCSDVVRRRFNAYVRTNWWALSGLAARIGCPDPEDCTQEALTDVWLEVVGERVGEHELARITRGILLSRAYGQIQAKNGRELRPTDSETEPIAMDLDAETSLIAHQERNVLRVALDTLTPDEIALLGAWRRRVMACPEDRP
jgi:DNA-directed RNA polymerase specialized sigma24 family protein